MQSNDTEIDGCAKVQWRPTQLQPTSIQLPSPNPLLRQNSQGQRAGAPLHRSVFQRCGLEGFQSGTNAHSSENESMASNENYYK